MMGGHYQDSTPQLSLVALPQPLSPLSVFNYLMNLHLNNYTGDQRLQQLCTGHANSTSISSICIYDIPILMFQIVSISSIQKSSSSRLLVRLEVICNNLKSSDKYIYIALKMLSDIIN